MYFILQYRLINGLYDYNKPDQVFELLTNFKDIENLPNTEQCVILDVISAYSRDYKAKQDYS